MRQANLKLDGDTMSRLKVLAAQIDKSPERTVQFLIDHHDAVLEADFEAALDAYAARRLDDARQSMAALKKRLHQKQITTLRKA